MDAPRHASDSAAAAAASLPGHTQFVLSSRNPSSSAVDQATSIFASMDEPFPPTELLHLAEPTSSLVEGGDRTHPQLLISPALAPQHEPTLSEGTRPFALVSLSVPPSPRHCSVVPATIVSDREMACRIVEELIKIREGQERLIALFPIPSVPAIIKAKGKRAQTAVAAADDNAPGSKVPPKRKPAAAAAAPAPPPPPPPPAPMDTTPDESKEPPPVAAAAEPKEKKKKNKRKSDDDTNEDEAAKRAKKELKKELKKAQKDLEDAQKKAASADPTKKKEKAAAAAAASGGLGYASSSDED